MTFPVILKLPLPPSINHYYASKVIKKLGKFIAIIYCKDEVHAFRKEVAEVVCHIVSEPIQGRLDVSVVVHQKNNRVIDLDNLLKGLLDSLTKAAVWNDDSQVDKITIERGRNINGGQCTVAISKYEALNAKQTN